MANDRRIIVYQYTIGSKFLEVYPNLRIRRHRINIESVNEKEEVYAVTDPYAYTGLRIAPNPKMVFASEDLYNVWFDILDNNANQAKRLLHEYLDQQYAADKRKHELAIAKLDTDKRTFDQALM